MATTGQPAVVGVFEKRTDAERAVDELHRAGFRDDQIGFASHGSGVVEGGTEAGEGAAKGLATGAGLGAILGALATGLIPGIGPVIAGGLLAGILGGAAVGAAAGGLFGALVSSMDVPEEEARYYDDEFKAGRNVVTVRANGRAAEARAILQRAGAYDYAARGTRMGSAVESVRETARPTVGTAATTDDTRTVQLREEELRARKTPVESGQVQLHKEVVSEQRSVDVPITREEVVIERRPVDRQPSDRPLGEGETIDVPVREERVDVEKRPVVYEEVDVGKRQIQDTERATDTVRREEARIETDGDVDLKGDVQVRRDEPRR